ncbi:MAG: double-strand break repair helicase AddA [Alphaproteobacteria bacterium]
MSASLATIRQREAAYPKSSVWVSASAGTGKTKVLTDRVLNLLLDGAAPERILCLTFTRAAAGEMSLRLKQRLSHWVTLSDHELQFTLEELTGHAPSEDQLLRARRLFSEVLDAPGGMKIQTIHAFCQAVLGKFPLEAQLPPHLSVMDGREARLLLDQTLAKVLQQPDHRQAISTLSGYFHDDSFRNILSELSKNLLPTKEVLFLQLQKFLGVDASQTMAETLEHACQQHTEGLQYVAETLLGGKKTDQTRGSQIQAWLKLPLPNRMYQFEAYTQAYLTSEGEIRKRLVTNDLIETCGAVLAEEAERVLKVREKLKALKIYEITTHLYTLADKICSSYRTVKRDLGRLDYEDLINETVKLLETPDIAPWVLYKLDGGIDHILVDEAQDTNPKQWRIIGQLIEEFFAGSGAREIDRTLFVVGDSKQSIYSFQGADPHTFMEMRSHISQTIQAAESAWRDVELDTSFRSTKAVLDMVDTVFKHENARQGVALLQEDIRHTSFRRGQGGLVESWPLVPAPEDEDQPGFKPLPETILARGIAKQIRRWLDNGEILAAKGRPIAPGDIMLLVQRRSRFVDILIREFKRADIPIAGSDRLVLSDHLAVQDVLSMMRFVLLPEDDLNLAALLKSPLVGYTEQQLFNVAHNRGKASIWQCLPESTKNYLEDIRQQTYSMTPYAFINTLLGPYGGRKALSGRMGPEVEDPLEELLNAALDFQKSEIPSLQGFLNWIESDAPEVKREGLRNDVRILTVHGSKGLQAPIVILPDMVRKPTLTDNLVWTQEGSLPMWLPPKSLDIAETIAIKDQQRRLIDQEYRRLLYVALTRAEDRLYLCGWETKKGRAEDCWYNLTDAALESLGTEVAFDLGWEGTARRYHLPQEVPVTAQTQDDKVMQDTRPVPAWLATHPRQEAEALQLVRPSFKADVFDNHAVQRGVYAHKLLQYLPEVTPDQRRTTGLSIPFTALEDVEKSEIIQSVINILEDPKLEVLFGKNSQAEVPIIGKVGNTVVSGQIDRLVVTPQEALIVDYKTHAKPPASMEEVPVAFLHQMAAYKAALKRIYPHLEIQCYLLWTQQPKMVNVSSYIIENINQ